MEVKDKKKFNYNVVIIVLCFMATMLGLGMWGTKSYFIKPITEALNITRAQYSIVDTMRYIFSALTSLFFGFLIEKFPTKVLFLIGFAFMLIAAILFSFTSNLLIFYIGGALYGTGIALSGTSMVGYVINLTCTKNRGTILGIVLAANGLGAAIAVQIIAPIINNSAFGYQTAYMVLAGVFLFMFIVLLIFYREPHKPEGLTIEKKKARGTGWVGISFDTAKKKIYFYGACVCIFFTGLCLQGVSTCSTPHYQDVGIPNQYIINIGTISSLLLMGSKFLTGFIYDRFGLRVTITIDCISGVIYMTLLYLVANSTLGLVLCALSVIFYAISIPLETVMLPIYANDLFGDKSYAKILGIFSAINQAGFALGAIVINAIFDAFNTYKVAFVICGAIMLAIVISLQFIITKANKVKKSVLLES